MMLTTLMKNLRENPPHALKGKILSALLAERDRLLARKKKEAFFGMLISGVMFLGASVFLGSVFFQSEFWALLSLVFSDFSILMNASQDFLYSLLETLPVTPLFFILAPLAAFFWSLSVLLSFRDHEEYLPFGKALLH